MNTAAIFDVVDKKKEGSLFENNDEEKDTIKSDVDSNNNDGDGGDQNQERRPSTVGSLPNISKKKIHEKLKEKLIQEEELRLQLERQNSSKKGDSLQCTEKFAEVRSKTFLLAARRSKTLARELSQSGEEGSFSEGTDLDKQSLLEAAENRRTSKLNKDSLGGSAKEELTELDKQSLLVAAADRHTRKSRVELLGRTDQEELTKSDKESLPAVVTNRRLGLARTMTSDEILTTTKQELSELKESHSAYSSNRRLGLA